MKTRRNQTQSDAQGRKKIFKTVYFPDGSKKVINKVGTHIGVKGKKVTVYDDTHLKKKEENG